MNLQTIISEAKAKPKEAAGFGAAAVGVAVLALYSKHKKAAAVAGAGSSATAGAVTAQDVAAQTAGLSGTPNTSATDLGNQLQDGLNSLQDQLNAVAAGASNTTSGAGNSVPIDDQPKYVQFLDAANRGAVYRIENGTAEWLSSKQWSDYLKLGAKLQYGSVLDSAWQVVAPVQAPAGATDKLPAPGIVVPKPVPSPLHPAAGAPVTGVRPTAQDYHIMAPGQTLRDAAAANYGEDQADAMASHLASTNGIRQTVTPSGVNIAHTYPGQPIKLA